MALQLWSSVPDEMSIYQMLLAVHERVGIMFNMALVAVQVLAILLVVGAFFMTWKLVMWTRMKMMKWQCGTGPPMPQSPPQAPAPVPDPPRRVPSPPSPRQEPEPPTPAVELRPRWLDLEPPPPGPTPPLPKAAQLAEPKAPPERPLPTGAPKAKAAAPPPPPAPPVVPRARAMGRKQATPEVTWQEMAACVEAGHPTVAGRNASAAYITCQACRKHTSWRRGAAQTFRNHAGLSARVLHYWQELRGVPGR